MRQCMFDASVDIRIWKPQTLVQRMSVLKNMMKDPGSPEAWGKDEHRDRNASLANAYQAVLRKTNRLDFDLPAHTTRRFRCRGEALPVEGGRCEDAGQDPEGSGGS